MPDGVSKHQPRDCLHNRLFKGRSKKTSKLRVTGQCAGNSPVTGEFPAQRASNAENVFIWWRLMTCTNFNDGLIEVCAFLSPVPLCYQVIHRPDIKQHGWRDDQQPPLFQYHEIKWQYMFMFIKLIAARESAYWPCWASLCMLHTFQSSDSDLPPQTQCASCTT